MVKATHNSKNVYTKTTEKENLLFSSFFAYIHTI